MTRPAAPSGWRGLWDARRARLWLVAAAVAAWLPALGVGLRGWLDFSAFYAAGALVFSPAVTSIEAVVAFQSRQQLPITPFVYPPGLALGYVPFAALPYALAAAVHLLLMLAALMLAARLGADLLGLPRRWALVGALAWGPAAAGVLSGQNTSLALLLTVLAARALSRRRDGAAGVAAGLLAYKPQLAAPLAGLLLLRLRWRALAVLAAVLAGHYLAGIVATGGDLAWPRAWLAVVTDARYAQGDLAANGWQAVSLPALLARTALLPGMPSLAIAGYAAAAAVVLACLPSLRHWPILPAVALASAAGLVISPHAWVYDATLLLPAVAVVAAEAARRGWPWQDRWLLAAGYGLALLWPLGGVLGLTPVLPVVLAAPFLLMARLGRRPWGVGWRGSPGTGQAAAV
ncbi:MAG TPA: glycosyltransferase 87 family protein [Candidatus Limnocylindrales bacterium]|nr:glycosyltransferase 87 family protein [Candidatus Limnocylindrales bacterium]